MSTIVDKIKEIENECVHCPCGFKHVRMLTLR